MSDKIIILALLLLTSKIKRERMFIKQIITLNELKAL